MVTRTAKDLLRSRWGAMMSRCYRTTYQNRARQKAYENATVCLSWQNFDNFFAWAIQQDYEGNVLDKDLLVPGNTEYRPDRCLFIPQSVNVLITGAKNTTGRSGLPLGVQIISGRVARPYHASVRYQGKGRSQGYYATPEEAHSAYLRGKATLLREVAQQQSDPRIAQGLLAHANLWNEQPD